MLSKSFFSRFGITFGIITTFVTPVTPFLNPKMTYLLPMELNFTENRVANFYLNFGIQTVAHINYASFILVNFILLYIFSINLTFELKFIATICHKIGNIEATMGDAKPDKCSIQAWSQIGNETAGLNNERTDVQHDTKALLKAIIKYHVNAIA